MLDSDTALGRTGGVEKEKRTPKPAAQPLALGIAAHNLTLESWIYSKQKICGATLQNARVYVAAAKVMCVYENKN